MNYQIIAALKALPNTFVDEKMDGRYDPGACYNIKVTCDNVVTYLWIYASYHKEYYYSIRYGPTPSDLGPAACEIGVHNAKVYVLSLFQGE